MSIAQQSVASEADARALLDEEASGIQAIDDVSPADTFQTDSTNLVWLTLRAAHRAAHVEQLSARSRALLAALARTVNARQPYGAIYARRELLTDRALVSMRTLYRALDDLETAGLITRANQGRYGGVGLFGRAHIYLTKQAAVLLGLDQPTEADMAKEQTASLPETPAAPTPSLASRPANVADGAIYKNLIPLSQKRQPARLPADLQRLTSLGFHEYFVLKLMREAKQHGKYLSDVVEATWDHLSKATAPINYLRALLRSTADFAHQAKLRKEAVCAAAGQLAAKERLRRELQTCAGKTYFDATVRRKFDVSPDATSMMVLQWDEAMPRVTAQNWGESFIAALKAGHIQEASEEQQRLFVSKRRPALPIEPPPVAGRSTEQPRTLTRDIEQSLTELKRLARGIGSQTFQALARNAHPHDSMVA